jgi:hypothetical protein
MSALQAVQITSFTVTKSNPSGTIIRFTITDSANLLTTSKMIRAVLLDAWAQYDVLERADLVVAKADYAANIFKYLSFKYDSKYMEADLSSVTNLSVSGTLTATAPFADAETEDKTQVSGS